MKGCFRLIKWFFATLFTLLLILSLFAGTVSTSISKKLSDRSTVYNWLDDSGVFGKISPIAEDIVKENLKVVSEPPDQIEDIIDAKFIGKVVSEIVTTELIKEETSKFTIAIYDWLEGETNTPEYTFTSVNLESQVKLALEEYLAANLKELDECTEEQLQNLGGRISNPLTLECLPSEVDVNDLIKLSSELPEDTSTNNTVTVKLEDSIPSDI